MKVIFFDITVTFFSTINIKKKQKKAEKYQAEIPKRIFFYISKMTCISLKLPRRILVVKRKKLFPIPW